MVNYFSLHINLLLGLLGVLVGFGLAQAFSVLPSVCVSFLPLPSKIIQTIFFKTMRCWFKELLTWRGSPFIHNGSKPTSLYISSNPIFFVD